MKFYLLIAVAVLFSYSCAKQSIADAMLNRSGKPNLTATFNYEMNGNPVHLSVKDADNRLPGYRKLYCDKSTGYYSICAVNGAPEFIFTFYTDSLKVGSYKYTSNFGPMYITTFKGTPQYVYNPIDHVTFNITSYKDGRISGNFSGQLTPDITLAFPRYVVGTPGSVLLKNGSFENVQVFY